MCWPVLGVPPGSPAAAGTASDAQEEQQQGHEDAGDEGRILTGRARLAGPRDRVAGSFWAFAEKGTVVSMEARWAGNVAAGPPEASTADTLPCDSITGSLDTAGTDGAAALPKGASRAGVFTPGPQPAGVTVCAVSAVWLTGLPTPAAGTLLPAALPKGAWGAGLAALGPVPARLAGLAAARVWRAGLVLLAVATAVTALSPIAAGGTGQFTAHAAEAGWAGAPARGGAAAAAHALAPLPALGAPPAWPAGAAASLLRAGRVVTRAAEAAAVAPPARFTQAGARGWLAARRRQVALARAAARG